MTILLISVVSLLFPRETVERDEEGWLEQIHLSPHTGGPQAIRKGRYWGPLAA